jgi:hypothetical protein
LNATNSVLRKVLTYHMKATWRVPVLLYSVLATMAAL